MKELPRPDELPLTIGALRMRVSYHVARTMMLQGELSGRQIAGRWYVSAADVNRMAAERRADLAQSA